MNFADIKRMLGAFSAKDTYDIVPPMGISAQLTFLTSAAMAFLAVFALALLAATERLADRWGSELSQSSTVRISAPPDQAVAQINATLTILEQTAGVASARALTVEEQQALLAPWLGPDLPLDDLPVPQLIEIVEDGDGYDVEGLRLRLRAEVPGAVLDDHTRWRRPLVQAAQRMRIFGFAALGLILLSSLALVTLAASTALAANAQVINVLRLIGARDAYVARAFVRRFTLRAAGGAVAGVVLALGILLLFPRSSGIETFLTGIRFQGAEWLWPVVVPIIIAIAAFWATRFAALRKLQEKR